VHGPPPMAPTALVVDKNAITGDRLAYWLTTLGVPATHVQSTDEAAHSLHHSTRPRFVVVASDLPDMDAFAELRHDDPVLHEVPLVVVSADGRSADPRLEPTYIVPPPPDSADFIWAVATLRDGESWLKKAAGR
jgi:CheY-like chemotaxis protein